MNSSVVIGIDGGGTHTRVLVCDLEGNQLAYLSGSGASSLYKDKHAVQNVKDTLLNALAMAKVSVQDVRYVTAGIAGYDTPKDLEWVSELTNLPGLHCPKQHINDAVAAHAGALLGKPGIVAISGTGSIILGVTESGRQIRNYDFHHYAASAARYISYETVYEVLAGHRDRSDEALLNAMLQHWKVEKLQDFAELARQGFYDDKRERDKQFGQFAPMVTDAAEKGSSAARLVCNRATAQIKVGIDLTGSAFASDEVEVAYIGSVISSAFVSDELTRLLADGRNKSYKITSPKYEPVVGSVLLALKAMGNPSPTVAFEGC